MHSSLKQLRFSGEPTTQCTCESRAYVNHMRMLKNSLSCHPTLDPIMNHEQEP